MKVLLCLTDLFREVGGGQTVHRELVRGAPSVQFTYFVDTESIDANRPSNCSVLHLLPVQNISVTSYQSFPQGRVDALTYADRIARSVVGRTFDVVDVPDFLTIGSYLRDAFVHHKVSVGAIILSMHGNISRSIMMNWGTLGQSVSHYESDEYAQFASVDGVYAYSRRYMREWQDKVSREITFFDPAALVPLSVTAQSALGGSGVPAIVSVGRSERRKGDDLFIDLVAKVRAYEPVLVHHVGPDDHSLGHTSSSALLKQFAQRRAVPIDFLGPRTQSQLRVPVGCL